MGGLIWHLENTSTPLLLLCKQVVSGGHVIVLAHLQALHSIVSREAKAVKLLKHVILKGPVTTFT